EGKSLKGYNTIFVEFYQVAEVTSVDVDDDATTITLANSACLLGDDEIEEIVIETEAVEEGKSIVSVTRNGEVASLDSLVNGDVIAYAANFGAAEGDTLTNPKEIKIIATNDTVSGTVTAIDKNDDGLYDDVFTIGGADYIIVPGKAGLPAINVKDSLDVVLDPFGRIYDIETNADSAQYAIALKLGTEDNFIKLLLADGTTKTYEVDTAKAKNFTEDFVENKINNVKDVADRVVAYEVSGKTGKITYIEVVSGDSFVDREYKSRTSLVAGNKILDTTPIIRIDTDAEGTVLSNNSDYYTVFTKDDLVNETVYSGYAYKINTTVAFMVITSAGTSFGESSRVALAIDNPAEALTEDGDKVWSVKAYYNGEEQDLLFAANPGEIRGTVFFFETDSDGYVDAIYTPAEGDEAWEKMIDVEDWSYVLWDEHKDIQFVEGVVVEATSNGITFAALDQVKSGKLNTTLDLDDTKADGIVTYAIADDCAAYTYDAGMKTTKETEKYDITSASSIKASNFSAFDNGNGKLNDGIYEGDLMSKATVATAMIVDGQIVAIFAIEL
ncbi:MAG: hypothetical protein IJ304_03670, partial [Clostridia bacterium]|nr:hypothetical protein [Clostridia bacterium]